MMTNQEIRVETVVRLRSGSPAMTVVSVSGQSAFCEWFHDGQVRRGEFPIAALDCEGE